MRIFVVIALVLLTLSPAAPAQGEFDPGSGPKAVRAAREAQVARVGVVARDLVEAYPEAAAALACCRMETARRLAEFHNAGGLNRVALPRDLLAAISRHRADADTVAAWAVENADSLRDVHQCRAYCHDPLPFCLKLDTVERAGAQWRGLEAQRGGERSWLSQLNLQQLTELPTLFAIVVMILLAVVAHKLWSRFRRGGAP